MAETGWRKSGLEEGKIAFAGSILLRMPFIRDALEERLRRTCPGLRPVESRGTPAEGAAKIAREKGEKR
jgi:hypothetical protein